MSKPHGNGNSEALANLATLSVEQKRALLAELLKKKNAAPRTFPVSPIQERFWLLDQLDPGSASYNWKAAIRFQGPLAVPVLERCINEIVRRHEVLRTTINSVDGRPVQIVKESLHVTLVLEDVQHVPLPQREAEALRRANFEVRRSFDLGTGPLIRTMILRLSAEEHILVLSIHHIVFDGWSIGVFVNELNVIYPAFLANERSPLPELAVQYSEHSVRQRQWLDGEQGERALAYWKDRLTGCKPVLEMQTDFPRPAVQRFEGATKTFYFSPELTKRLKQFSRDEKSTLFMTLLASLQTLLMRYSGQEDLQIGCPIDTRNTRDVEGLIGCFVNTLVMRTDLSGNPTFRELLNRVRETAVGAYSHRDLPFERLVKTLQLERDMSRTPLVQVSFGLRNTAAPEFKLQGLRVSSLDTDTGASKFDLSWYMADLEPSTMCRIEYDTDLYQPQTIEQIHSNFLVLLEGLIASPTSRLSELPLLTAEERRRMLVEWGGKPMAFADTRLVPELFADQARQNPGAIALVHNDRSMTYADLERRANQLAHYLRRQGVGAEKTVGICLERSLEMVVSVLGILKAGGAYVPLNSEQPPDRLAFIVKDAGAVLVLTQRSLHSVNGDLGVPSICLDDPALNLDQEPATGPEVTIGDNDLAYIIYTSGSTGKPKGVMIEHGSLRHAYHGWEHEYGLLTTVRNHLQMANFSFDVWTGDFVRSLCSGGKLVICPHETLLEADKLHALILREKIDAQECVPAVMRNLMSFLEATGRRLDTVRLVVVGADTWHAGEHERLKKLVGPQTRVLNSYGVTEATIDSSYFEGDVSALPQDAVVPIGKPFPNTAFHVLDKHLAMVPVGVPGELHIGGPGLARGYAGRPDLTAEKFVADPFSTVPGARLYKSGDLARWRHTGEVEFLGRIDQQVKIRGLRIELGEIETVLGRHPDVKDVVVHAWADGRGEKQLVAYVVVKNAPVGVSELRNFVGNNLPNYMVPSAFVFLETLPRTASGKVNRQALPAPVLQSESRDAYVAPRNEIEQALAAAWAEVLKIPQVSVNDNFFELGGHSLLAAQAVSRASASLNRTITLRELFQNPTVAQLASCLQATEQDRRHALPPIPRAPRDGPLPLSFPQLRLWILDRFEPHSMAYSMSSAIRLRGHLDMSALEGAVAGLVRRHESLRTTFAESGDEPVQVIAPPGRPPLTLVEMTGAGQEELNACIAAETRVPFDLSAGPLFRMVLVRLGAEEHVLIVLMHHTISDGQSINVLVREFSNLYRGFASGLPAKLAELPIQYVDYAVWQRQYLQGAHYEQLLAYWKQRLAGLTTLELPTDRPRPAVQRHLGSRRSLSLSAELRASVGAFARRENVTPFMVYLTAFQALLHRYSGQDDIIVGTPIANRPTPETYDLIGFFANTLVLRNDLSGDPTFRELLGRVREGSLAAFEHQDIPFERLVEELNPRRDTSRNPIFQVSFALDNFPDDMVSFSGLKAEKVPVAIETAKFDLTLMVRELPNLGMAIFEYDQDLFDAVTVERMLGHYQAVLEQMVAQPEQHLSDMSMLSAAERQQLMVEWNSTKADYPDDKCLHHLFEDQVARTPDAVALSCDGRNLSYRELNGRANQLAHHLRAIGVGPEALVGLCVERSIDMFVGVLGVLKAGAAYVPLDPTYPQERLSYMLSDSKARVLVTQKRLTTLLPTEGIHVVPLDAEIETLAASSEENLVHGGTPDSVAYVIYTSGSTGNPKGVEGTHRGAVNRCAWMWKTYPFGDDDVACQKTALSFVDSVWEIFGPLLRGVRIAVLPDATVKDTLQLVNALAEDRVSRIVLVPSLLRGLLDTGVDLGKRLSSLRIWICSGEALPLDLAERFRNAFSEAVLINLYGSSEVAADVTYYDSREGLQRRSVPIGRPIANSQVYVLDRNRQPVATGIAGELYVAGAGLARGYHGRPDLTAERFLPNPFDPTPGSKLFKTGDHARWLPDGNLEYLGRRDDQVKIRGFRIELGEVETALAAFPDVRQAAVVVREVAPGDLRMIGYAALRMGTAPTAVQIKSALRERLPEYMVPATIVFVDDLPLTPSGKINRLALKALPVAGTAGTSADESFVAPRTLYEEQIAAIWAGLLKVDQVGVHDNFFDLGGHSLLAAHAVNKIGMVFNLVVPIRALFENSTLEGLARWVEEHKHHSSDGQERLKRRTKEAEELPLTSTQEGFYFVIRTHPNRPTAFIGNDVRIKGDLDVDAMVRAINEVVRRHDALRMTFLQEADSAVQLVNPYEAFEVPLYDLSELSEPDRAASLTSLRVSNRFELFNFAVGPLYRFKLVRLSDQEHALLMTVHHIVFDGTSMTIFARDLLAIYEAFRKKEPSPLAELPCQFSDYVLWLQEHIERQDTLRVQEYAQKLAANMKPLELATDYPRPAHPTRRGAEISLEFPPELSQAIRTFQRQSGITPYMTLLAAFEAVLQLYSGQEHIRVITPVANRTPVETENLIGCFIKLSILSTQVGDDPTFSELVARLRNDTLEAYENQVVPLAKLKALAAENQPGALNRGEPVEVMFLLQNFAKAELKATGETTAEPVAPFVIEPLDAMLPGLGSIFQAEDAGVARLVEVTNQQLLLECTEKDGVFAGKLTFQTDLFRVETAERMCRYLVSFLRAGIAAPDKRLSELPILSEEERRWLTTRDRALLAPAAREQWVHQIIEHNARTTPDAIAVTSGEQRLSYAELNARANRLAHSLCRREIGVGQKVALCLERSADMAVAVLGVFKAGAAYVPLNPEHDPEQLRFVVADAGAALLLTHASLRARHGDLGVPTILLDDAETLFAQEPETNPHVEMTGDSLAYILYTSGSTGQPKGVMISHASLLNAWRGWDEAYKLSASRPTYLQLANFTFDVWPADFVRALCSGGRLVLCPFDVLADAEKLLALIVGERVDAMEIVPVVMRNLMSYLIAAGKRLDGMRLIVVGADVWYVKEHKTLKTLVGPQTRVLNSYGVTEATIDNTYFDGDVSELPDDAIVPIGKPFANTQLYVLDRHLRLMPVGVWGELYIGGPGVALGYLNRAELTAEKFIANPFAGEPGARLYKTGDRVRWRTDGDLEFSGRLDGQVKIRGLRIETGAIELALKEHPAIKDAVVVAHREESATDAQLVAYIVPRQERAPALHEVRSFLSMKKMARHMIPAMCVPLTALPLLAAGKVDRQALPAPDPSMMLKPTGYVAPSTPIEEKLCAIISDVLLVEQVGIFDDFFALGGTSMSAMQVALRARKEFGVKNLPIAGLMAAPTISELAERITAIVAEQQEGEQNGTTDPDEDDLTDEASSEDEARSAFELLNYRSTTAQERLPLVSLQPRGTRLPFYLVHGIDGGAVAFAELAREFGEFDRPLFGLQARGLYHIGAPIEKIEEMAANYASAILREQPIGPHLLGGWSMGGPVVLAIARQLEQKGIPPALVVLLDPFFPTPAAKKNLKWVIAQNDSALFPVVYPQLFARLGIVADRYQAMSPTERIEIFRSRMLRLGAAFGKVDVATMNSVLLTYRAHARALLAHSLQSYSGRVLFLKASGKSGKKWNALRAPVGWKRLLGQIEAFRVPGDHRGMLKGKNATLLAEQLAKRFDELKLDNPPSDA